jgi:hypothetical protein
MKYFNTLPKISYVDKNGVSTYYTNLLSRASLIPSTLTNVLSFYEYSIQDEDTPEIIAHKYYGSVDRFWMVLYANQINDPQWDWPLSGRKFEKYVKAKYGNTLDDLHHYEMVITKSIEGSLSETTTEKHVISEEDYNALVPQETHTYTLPEEVVTITTTKQEVSNYEYEILENEKKRNIKLLNKDYATQLEKEFMKLMK